MDKLNYGGPVVLVVMDGVGLSRDLKGNAVLQAHTEFLDKAVQTQKTMGLKASGEAVGILAGQMGNSEVGHNALGAGQIIKQGIAKIEDELETGKIWESTAWTGAIANVKAHDSTLHFSGIFSDGGVHSDINHLEKMLKRASEEKIKRVRIHLVLDGRDVPPRSAEKYVDRLEKFLDTLKDEYGNKRDYKIAGGGGRMVYVADRYETDWEVVKRGWDAIVYGKAENYYGSASEAISELRRKNSDILDQYLPPFVLVENGEPVGKVSDGDSFIYYDFRADRAIEIAEAFTYDNFDGFDRGTEGNRKLDVFFAGMTEYNSDTHVPQYRLIEPVEIKDSLHEFLGRHEISQLSVAETAKFGHITYYFNGNSYEKYNNEKQIEIESDTRPYNERPWMKAAETTDALLDEIENYKFIRINYAGGDMVGHFGDMEATITAMEAIDIQLSRLAKKLDEIGGMMIITADHGNAEELLDENGEPKTSHSTNLVPCIFYDNTENAKLYDLNRISDAGLSNIASTLANLLGFDNSEFPESWRESLIKRL
ncbi:2,3-bisphosphoglycerate-independent phosphoglycerate mutase [Candidatus Saccharibacteria bacterium]|nr:2,3-bisphosphoglycerate-independent phosphoglycerate mutase [Candidatus Saccharibacteria bacterium]